MRKNTEDDFHKKYRKGAPNECWLWTGSFLTNGYGRFFIKGKTITAHRFSWELANGPIPEDLFILHKCDTPACVNPAHLSPGTPSDNMRDRDSRGRQARLFGETNPNAKLTESKVQQIRMLRGKPYPEIAKAFGISKSAVCRIMSGISWPRTANGRQ